MLECWSVGVLEWWDPITPLLHYSSPPAELYPSKLRGRSTRVEMRNGLRGRHGMDLSLQCSKRLLRGIAQSSGVHQESPAEVGKAFAALLLR